ncbi:MAG TPA: hypothetical protein VF644_03795 [Pyrinomonadaceae bacterium]|jgi:hypothetical protein
MNNIRFTVLPFILLCFLIVASGQEISQRRTPADNSANDIRQIDFKNFTFTRQKGEEAIQFRDGKYVGDGNHKYDLMRIAYGDLTGDGNEEAIVLLRGRNTPASRILDEVFIYGLKNKRAALLTNFEGRKRGDYILSIGSLGSNFRVENNILIIDQAVALEDDNDYIPTRFYTIKYRLNGKRMIEIERTELKSIPENMREIG